MMHQVIDDRSKRNDALVNGLFIRQKDSRLLQPSAVSAPADAEQSEGVIQSLKSGFGFITPTSGGANVFFTSPL